MPRKARQKHEAAIYHIISRSFSEVLLFREDQDKEYYLMLLKRYAGKYHSSVYAYCLMDNHVHIHLDPKDMIYQSLCQPEYSFVRYYNIKYEGMGIYFKEDSK